MLVMIRLLLFFSCSSCCLSCILSNEFLLSVISSHTQAMINKLKQAGLGYNVGEEHTTDKFGKLLSQIFARVVRNRYSNIRVNIH